MWTLLFVCAKDFRFWSTLHSDFLEQGSSCGLDVLILFTIQSRRPLETEAALALTTSQARVLESLSSGHLCNDSGHHLHLISGKMRLGKVKYLTLHRTGGGRKNGDKNPSFGNTLPITIRFHDLSLANLRHGDFDAQLAPS